MIRRNTSFPGLFKALDAAGLDPRYVELGNHNGRDGSFVPVVKGIMIDHDYMGLYPDAESREIMNAARDMAKRAGFRSEVRGFYQATLIYNERG